MEQKMVNLKIDNIPVSVPAGTSVLEAARSAGIKIPSLCFLKDINEIGACRICVVEVKGAKSLVWQGRFWRTAAFCSRTAPMWSIWRPIIKPYHSFKKKPYSIKEKTVDRTFPA